MNLRMSVWRTNFVLLVLVLLSAFYLVGLQYESRTVFTQLDKAQSAARKLETERDTLEVQKRAQAAALRVQTLARGQLRMANATPAITQYVTLNNGKVVVSTPVDTKNKAPAGGQP